MSREIIEYLNSLKNSGKAIRIEAEMKGSKFPSFFREYQSATSDQRTKEMLLEDKCITLLDENENKWGVELRLYYQDGNSIPQRLRELSVKPRSDRNDPFTHRLNNNEIIRELFINGFKLGNN